jgi:hypothetical protein
VEGGRNRLASVPPTLDPTRRCPVSDAIT